MKAKIVFLTIAISMTLTACKSSESFTELFSEEVSTKSSSTDMSVDDKETISIIEITIASKWAGEGITQESLNQTVKDVGYESAILNKDGSVTYTMSLEKQQEILDALKETMEYYCADILHGEDAIEAFDNITMNDDMSQFNIYVNSDIFSDEYTDSYIFFMSGEQYQAFSGVSEEDIDVEVNYIDSKTNNILLTEKLNEFSLPQQPLTMS